IVPADEPLLQPYLGGHYQVLEVGKNAAVELVHSSDQRLTARVHGSVVELELEPLRKHELTNALFALAAAQVVGVKPSGRYNIKRSQLRGEQVRLNNGAVLINDCYNASPLSMQAALTELAAITSAKRRIAVLADMLELGMDAAAQHRQIGDYATKCG